MEERFDGKLDSFGQRMEDRFDGKLDSFGQRMEDRFDGKLDSLGQRMEGRFDAREQRMLDRTQEMIRDSETRILRALYAYTESNDKRTGQLEGNVTVFFSRLTSVETRLLEVEKRLNIPPHTQ